MDTGDHACWFLFWPFSVLLKKGSHNGNPLLLTNHIWLNKQTNKKADRVLSNLPTNHPTNYFLLRIGTHLGNTTAGWLVWIKNILNHLINQLLSSLAQRNKTASALLFSWEVLWLVKSHTCRWWCVWLTLTPQRMRLSLKIRAATTALTTVTTCQHSALLPSASQRGQMSARPCWRAPPCCTGTAAPLQESSPLWFPCSAARPRLWWSSEPRTEQSLLRTKACGCAWGGKESRHRTLELIRPGNHLPVPVLLAAPATMVRQYF